MSMMEKILLVEDEGNIAAYIKTILQYHEYQVLSANTGKSAIHMAATCTPELIVLDLGLPDVDGMEVLRSIREWSDVPIIILSARQREEEKVNALDGGANDYITKPFGNEELLARIRSAIRIHRQSGSARMVSAFSNGGLFIDYEKRLVIVDGKAVHLTPIEYKIVVLLAQNAGKVLTHDQILNQLWGPFTTDSQLLRVNVANIRRKIENNPADPVYIVTEVGVGYRMLEIGHVS